MKTLLILAYRFPPQGGGGVQRTLKVVKYLPRFGWWPVVHTVKNPFWPLRDQTLLAEIPAGVRVYRTRTFEFERLEQWLGRSLRGGGGELRALATGQTRAPATQRARQGRGLGRRLRELAHSNLLLPDPQIAWVPAALVKSLYIARHAQAQAIYTSSPPNSVQLLGLLLKRLLHRPWVADFRDPWTEGVRRKEAYRKHLWRGRLEERWERAVVSEADHVIVSTDETKEQFLAKHPGLGPKLTVLTNGFDSGDFAHLSPQKRLLREGQFHLTLTGNVETMFDAIPFFRAIQDALAEHPEMRSHLRVNFIGTKRGKYDDWIRENGLTPYIDYVAYVPHAECLQYLTESDVLFLCQIPVHASAGVKLPGKLFEYLPMRKPVLALTIPGETAHILERAGLGVVVDPHDIPAIKDALIALYRQWRQGRWQLVPDEAFIGGFDRAQTTGQLSKILDTVTSR
jgi:glycosyltransferase involved in cell wall biosynthesis